MRLPVRRTQPGEPRHHVDAMIVRHPRRHVIGLAGVRDQPEPIAQPLYRRPCDEDRPLQCICHLATQPARRPWSACPRGRDRLRPGVQQREATRAVGGFTMPGVKQAWPPTPPADRPPCRRSGCSRPAAWSRRTRRCCRAPWAAPIADAEQGQQFYVPVLPVDVEQQRAGGIGGIGRMRATLGQPPQQERVHRAERQLAPFGAGADAGWSSNQASLVAEKYGSSSKPGARPDQGLGPIGAKAGAELGGATVLPHDRTADRLARAPVPQQRGFPLVGDPERHDRNAGPGQCLTGPASASRQISSASCSTQPGPG